MEKLEFDVSANLSPLRKDLNTARDDIKGFNDRMKSQTAIELSINVARLKSDLAAVRERLKQDLPKEASIMLSAKAERLSKDISQAGRELTNFLRTGQSDTSVLGKLFDGVQSKFSYFSAALQAVGVGGVGYLSKSVIELASNLQQNQIAFTTMLGSADAAKKMLADLSDFAKKTPFELVGIRETAKQLLAMGVTQENMIPTMKMLWDVAAGLSVPMDRLGLAYGQVLAKGRLQGGELKQFTEAGVPMIAELAKNLGKTQAEISKMVENGEIGAKDVTKAFETMTTGTGRFADLMDKQSQTLAGKWSNLVDATTQLGEKIGMYFIPILTKAVDALSALGQFFGTAAGKAVLIGTAVATLTFGIGMLIPVVIGLAGAFTTAAAAGGLLEWVLAIIGWPITLVALGLGALGAAAYYGYENFNGLTGATGELQQQLNDLKDQQDQNEKAFKDGTISQEQYTKATEDNKAAQDRLKQAIDGVNNGTITYGTIMEQINGLKKIADTQAYEAERKVIEAEISALKELIKQKQIEANGKLAEAKAKYGNPDEWKTQLSFGGSTAPMFTGQAAIDRATKYLDSEQYKAYQKGQKEINDLQKQADAVNDAFKKSQEERAKSNNKINYWALGDTGGGGKWGKKGKSAATLAKEELDAQKKLLEDKAANEIRAVNASEATEVDKAKRIIAISDKLKTDLKLIDGKYTDVQVENSQKVLKDAEDSTNKLKKTKEDAYTEITKKEKEQIDNVQKLGKSYEDLKKQLADVSAKGVSDIKAINEEIAKLTKNLQDIQDSWQKNIAGRGVEAAKELKDLQDKRNTSDGWNADDYQKALDLQKEIDLVNSNTTPQERAEAINQSLKSKAQLLIDELKVNEEKAKKDLADAEAKKVATQAQIDLEKKGIQDKMDATALLITNETKTMIEEDAKRRKLEAEYTDFFTGEIAKRTEAMTALKQAVADAKLAIESAGINQATLTGAAGNSTAVSVVNNIANNVDMESAMRYVNSKIPTK